MSSSREIRDIAQRDTTCDDTSYLSEALPWQIKQCGFQASFLLQEAEERESKRWLLEEFVKENEIRAIDLEKAYKRFRDIVPAADIVGGPSRSMEMDFDTWMTVNKFMSLRAYTFGLVAEHPVSRYHVSLLSCYYIKLLSCYNNNLLSRYNISLLSY